MDEHIAQIEEQCRNQIQAYVKCVDDNPSTWHTVCSTEKKNLNDCSSVNPMIQAINSECREEFQKYDKCLKDNPNHLHLCFDILEKFNDCAGGVAAKFHKKK